MRKLATLLLLLAMVPAPAWALSTDDLLATIAMPLAVAAVSNAASVPSTRLADLVTTLNQANVPPTQFVSVIRYVPVALNDQEFVVFVQDQSRQGVVGDALVTVIADRLRTRYDISPTLALTAPATTVVLADDYIPPVIVTRVTTVAPSDPLSVIAMPLAVAAVADITGVSRNELANFVATLNQANVPPVQVIEVLRYVPVALVVDNGQPFVQFVQQQVAQGVTGPALVPVIVHELWTFFPPQTQITVAVPVAQAVIVDQNFVPPVVVTRVREVRAHPHGGPPGQLKKQLGLQTGAEVVHGVKPGRQFKPAPARPVVVVPEKGRGHGKRQAAPSPMISSSPPAPAASPVAAPPANPPGKAKGHEAGGPPGKRKGKGGAKGHGKD